MEETKADIFNCGKELFSSKGFKGTNVSDITKTVGIGVGKFYKYYSSKEQLFIDIFLDENDKLKKSIMESVNLDDDPIKVVKEIIALDHNGMKSNPILNVWYNRDFISKLEKEYYKLGGIDKSLETMDSVSLKLFTKWKSEGKVREDIDDEFINTLFKSLLYIDIHKEEIGMQYFPQIIEYITECIMKNLLISENKNA
ncbi:transcriptional regulator, TetR family [Anaerovirgula multivorans]|uniref:Transcriptional regulator, TetR family n=1 Tax=Anaerovirgula multivorans TaxID=312168 RepID=A0A239IGA1_9FIRM|nr:TetR/AcrR family transcriptional regulator [Anaerovirgula multivorans]SNS92766.1 transcriptional regulator, TetR family [Anaerovirgula multivorans]